MKNYLYFEYEKLRPRPMGILMAIGIFMLVLLLEILLSSVFYSVGYFGFKQQPIVASVIINLGLWVTKLIILFLVGRLVLEKTPPQVPNALKRWVPSSRISALLLLSLAVIISFRLGYDSAFGQWVVTTFGIDPSLTESMELILKVPTLGVIFLWFIAPVYEEIIYRGMVYGGLRRKGYGKLLSAVVAALLFSLMHMNIAQSINAFFIGLLLAFVYEATGNLSAAIWLHVINNMYVTISSGYIDAGMSHLSLGSRIGLSGLGLMILVFTLVSYNKKAAQLCAEPREVLEGSSEENR